MRWRIRWVIPRDESSKTLCLFFLRGGPTSAISSSAALFPLPLASFLLALAAFADWALSSDDMVKVRNNFYIVIRVLCTPVWVGDHMIVRVCATCLTNWYPPPHQFVNIWNTPGKVCSLVLWTFYHLHIHLITPHHVRNPLPLLSVLVRA